MTNEGCYQAPYSVDFTPTELYGKEGESNPLLEVWDFLDIYSRMNASQAYRSGWTRSCHTSNMLYILISIYVVQTFP